MHTCCFSNVAVFKVHFCSLKLKCLLYNNGLYYKCFRIVIYDRNDSDQYYKTRFTIIIDDPSLSQCRSQPQLVSSFMIISDATIWSVTTIVIMTIVIVYNTVHKFLVTKKLFTGCFSKLINPYLKNISVEKIQFQIHQMK